MLKRIKLILQKGSFIKSIYYNFKYLTFGQAFNFPLIVAKNCTINGNGKIKLPKYKNLKIYLGQKTLKWDNEKKNYTYIFVNGILEFTGDIFVGLGTKIEVSENAYLKFGKSVTLTGNSKIICKNNIEFGDDNLISWDTLFLDSDGHTIISNNTKNNDGKIKIGNHVWIGCNTTVKKNTVIANNVVVASNSVLVKEYKGENIILAGNIAKTVKENIEWSIDIPKRSI